MELKKSDLYRHNYLFLVLEGSLFTGGTGFLNASTVIPVFINMITHSKELVGLTLTLGALATYMTRLLAGPFLPHVRDNVRFTVFMMWLCRPQTILPALLVFTGHYYGAVAVLIFSYTFLWAGDGVLYISWSEVMANTVDAGRHGRLLGMQMLAGGFASVGAGLLINLFLTSPGINAHTSFGLIFLLGGLLLAVSCVMMSRVQTYPQAPKTGRVDWKGYYRGLPRQLVEEKENTWQLCVQLVYAFAAMCSPFIILFASDRLEFSTGRCALLILAQTLGTPLGGLMWGQVCDRLGSHAGMRLAGAALFLPALLALCALARPGAAGPVLLVCMFLCGINSQFGTCSYVYTIQAVRPESRSVCLVLSSVIAIPSTFAGGVAGLLSASFGYTALFVICLALAAAGFLMSLKIPPVCRAAERRLNGQARLS